MNFYQDLYNSIENPLDKAETMQKLVAGFSGYQNMYSILMSSNSEQKKFKGQVNHHSKDELYKKLFSIWRFNVRSLSNEQVEYLISHNIVDSDYNLLRDFLQSKTEISGYNEYVSLVEDANGLFKKYGWHTIGSLSDWIHISSGHLTARRGKSIDEIEHRLYLNAESIDTELIASIFIDKCMSRGIPFYFKYDDCGIRDDTIVIYSDSANLKAYIEILREIKLEQEEVASRIQEPPIVTGVIDGWIGYGSEPGLLPDGNRTSFNLVRSKAIQAGFEASIYSWIHKNLLKPIKYNGKMINLFEYLVIKISQDILLKYRRELDWYIERGEEDRFFELFGLVKEDFQNDSLESLTTHFVRMNLSSVINACYLKEPIKLRGSIPARNSKRVEVLNQDFESAFAKVVPLVLRNDPKFMDVIKENIMNESATFGVDSQKYCFDESARDKLFAIDMLPEEDISDPKR